MSTNVRLSKSKYMAGRQCEKRLWLGTRPFEHIPFQCSCHVEKAAGDVVARGFLDVSGNDPRRELARSLIKTCGKRGPVLVYGNYESKCLAALSRHLPDLAEALDGIRQRLLNLLPLMQDRYYHPSMGKSWSLKSVLPTVVPSLGYRDLGDVADGIAAQNAYLEAVDPATKPSRRAELKTALKRYCERDTWGLVEMVRVLSKRQSRLGGAWQVGRRSTAHGFPPSIGEGMNRDRYRWRRR